MKVMLLNGSPHEKGCTYTALEEVQRELKKCGVESEILHVGQEDIHGCIGCGYCGREGRCVFDDAVDRIGARLDEFDGYVFGTPVYYAGISGQMKSFMDRLFYAYKNHMQYKPAAAVVSARRGGCVSTFDDINRFFTISCMPVVPSQYWNQVHGAKPEDVRKDEEGLQIMRTLAQNMAWMLKLIELGKKNGLPHPEREPFMRTNFIR